MTAYLITTKEYKLLLEGIDSVADLTTVKQAAKFVKKKTDGDFQKSLDLRVNTNALQKAIKAFLRMDVIVFDGELDYAQRCKLLTQTTDRPVILRESDMSASSPKKAYELKLIEACKVVEVETEHSLQRLGDLKKLENEEILERDIAARNADREADNLDWVEEELKAQYPEQFDDEVELASNEHERGEVLNQRYMDSLVIPVEECKYEQAEREAIQTEHLATPEATDFFKPREKDSDNDDCSTDERVEEGESKISFSRVSIKGFYSSEVALIGIGDEIRYVPVFWENESYAISKRREVSVSYGDRFSVCELQISIDNDGIYYAFPLCTHGGRVQFLAPSEHTRYAEIKASIMIEGSKKIVEVDTKAQTESTVFSRDKVLCRVVKSGKKISRFPLSGWFESVGGKWLYMGDSTEIYWLYDIQEPIKSQYQIGTKVRHQESFGVIWEVLSTYYSESVLYAKCLCLKHNDIYKEGDTQSFPIVQLTPVTEAQENKTPSYTPTPANEKHNNLLDSIALKKAIRASKVREDEDRFTLENKREMEPQSEDLIDRF